MVIIYRFLYTGLSILLADKYTEIQLVIINGSILQGKMGNSRCGDNKSQNNYQFFRWYNFIKV